MARFLITVSGTEERIELNNVSCVPPIGATMSINQHGDEQMRGFRDFRVLQVVYTYEVFGITNSANEEVELTVEEIGQEAQAQEDIFEL